MSTAFKPSAYQQALFDALADTNDSLIVNAVAGSGKCLGRGTPVMLFDGSIIPVESVKADDLLMGPDSSPRRVLSTSNGYGPLYKIIPTKGVPWICNDVHILTLMGTNRHYGEVRDVALCDLIKETAHTAREISANWKLWRVPVDFPEQNVPLDPYLAGVWLGDGHANEPRISNAEFEIVDYCEKYATQNGLKFSAKWEDENNTYLIDFRVGARGSFNTRKISNPFTDVVRTFVDLNGDKFIPREYLINSRNIRAQILAGILDTDGYTGEDSCTFDFVNKSKDLAENVVFLCRSLGLAAYMSEKIGTIKKLNFSGLYYRVSISGDVNQIPCKVLRRQAPERKQIKRVSVTGFEAEPIGDGEFFGFTLDGDGRFLLGDFTVTHNTTSIIEGLSYIPQKKTILMLAFNKSIAEELSKKVPPGVEVATFHSVGYRAWMFYCGKGKVAVDSEKLWKIVRDEWSKKDRDIYGSFCVRMVGLAKNAGVGTYIQNDIPAVWEDLMFHFDVTPQSQDCDLARAIQLCSELLTSSISRNKFSVDFDDMLYAPLRERSTFKRYDLVFIDEAQDTNGVQRELLKRMVAPGGRLIAVGDPCQAIYGFRGADSEAMNKIMDEFSCKPLPLSISYRCAQNVVKEAQKYVSHIEAWESADEGIVDELKIYSVEDFGASDAVLCRNVAPLVDFAYGMISRGQGVNFLGRDIGQGLISLIKKMSASSLDELEVKLSQYRDREEARLRLRNQESAIEALRDRVECLFVCIENLSENQRSIDALIGNIQELFAKKDGRLLTLSTVHKSKGMEWNRVFILDRWRMPSRYATQPWQQVQETNLIYVAVTRAKRHLTYINGKSWKT